MSEENAGEAAVVESAWIGADTPKSVTDVELTDVEGKPQVTFRAPAEGVNGGYIDVGEFEIQNRPGSRERDVDGKFDRYGLCR